VDVRVLVRKHHDVSDLESAGVRVVRGDATDRDTVADAADGCPVIYHLAAARGGLKLSYRAYQRENGRISEAVGEGAMAAGVDRLVVSSSAALTGFPGPGLETEETVPKPNSAYRASRLGAELVLEEFGRRGLEVVFARVPQRVMGPGARDWAHVARGVRDGRYRVLPGDGTIHSADVDDVVDGLRLCATSPGVGGERILLGGPGPNRIVDVLRAMADSLGVPFEPRTVPGAPLRAYLAAGNALFRATRRSLPHHYTAELFSAQVGLDLSKARASLGYHPRYEMPESVDRTVGWLRSQGLV
jgi:nucleoside-diphosphate-sugar epimerase